MEQRRRRFAIIASLAVMAMLAARHPSANVEFLTHDTRDTAPHRLQAAVDLGVVAVSVLYTWSVRPLAR